MNFFIGFLIVFACGMASIFGLGVFLESKGYSENEILIYRAILAFIVISIPPLLIFFGGHNHSGDNKLEELGKPVTSFASIVGHSLSSPTSLIIFLLVIVLNVLLWK